TGHAADSDVILGDNGEIFRLVGVNGGQTATRTGAGSVAGIATYNGYLSFNYDNYSATAKIVVRATQMLDYSPGGADFNASLVNNRGGADEIHGEGGDDFIFGQVGNDVLFGDGQNDTIVGGYGADWISGGNGDDAILGDDGVILASRVSTTGEALNGVAGIPTAQQNVTVSDGPHFLIAVTNVTGNLTYVANLTPDNLDPSATPNVLFAPRFANDIIFGGLGTDSIHGGAGDDAISGAEAMATAYITNYDASGNLIGMTSNSSINGAVTASRLVVESDFYHPFNPGNPLGYDPATTKFALYDAADPLREILLTSTGTLSKVVTAGVATGLNWFLNFDSSQGPVDTHWIQGQTTYAGVPTDGDDIIFGDLGNDWLAGGTGRDQLYGGWGDDLMNADDYLTTAGGLNNTTDTNPSYEDLVYGGAGRDVLIANTEGDRL